MNHFHYFSTFHALVLNGITVVFYYRRGYEEIAVNACDCSDAPHDYLTLKGIVVITLVVRCLLHLYEGCVFGFEYFGGLF